MEPLTILVPGVVKQGPGCGFDRLQDLANGHRTIRRRPGHGSWDGYGYGYRRLVDSVSFPSPELPAGVGRTVVERGHRVAGKSLAPRCAAAVIPSWPGPTSTIRPTAACRWTRRGAWSGTCPGPAGGWAARLAAEGIPLRKAPERLPPGGHVTARQPAPGGRGGAAPARPEAGGQGGGRPRGDRR